MGNYICKRGSWRSFWWLNICSARLLWGLALLYLYCEFSVDAKSWGMELSPHLCLKAQVIPSALVKQISLSSSDQFHGFNATLTAPSLSPFLPWPHKAAYCVCSPAWALPISSLWHGMLIPTPGSNYCVCEAHPGPVLPSQQLTLLTPLYLLPTVGSPGSGRNEGKGRSTSKGEPIKFLSFANCSIATVPWLVSWEENWSILEGIWTSAV